MARRGRCLRDVVPAGQGARGRGPAPGRRHDPRHRSADHARPALHRADPRPAAGVHRGTDADGDRAALCRGSLARRVLPRHAGRPRHAQDVRPQPRAGRHDPDDQPPVRRHDDGGPADRVPDLARARVGRCRRGRAGGGRDQPAPDGRARSPSTGRWRCSSSCPSSSCRCASSPPATTRAPRVVPSPLGRSPSSTSRSRRATAAGSGPGAGHRRPGRRGGWCDQPGLAISFRDVWYTYPGRTAAGGPGPRPRDPRPGA